MSLRLVYVIGVLGLSCLLLLVIYSLFDCVRCGGGFDAGGVGCGF